MLATIYKVMNIEKGILSVMAKPLAGTVLIKSGIDAVETLSLISQARGVQVPDTQEQEDWLKSL